MDDDTDDVYRAKRFYEIDTIKGVATILMVIFHFFYLMYHMKIAEYNIRCGPLYASAKIAHILFIFAVGVNQQLAIKNSAENIAKTTKTTNTNTITSL